MPLDAVRHAGGPAPAREWDALDRLTQALRVDHAGRIALVSSFGSESVVLLHLVARIDPATPVLFNETGMLFAETLAYQHTVADGLGLQDVRVIRPAPDDLATHDPSGTLHRMDKDACCAVRKSWPLTRALDGFDAWISGRKRFQSSIRATLSVHEADAHGRTKLNPLAEWTPPDIETYMRRHALPRHPLVASGFPSIGCAPCTSAVSRGEDPRAGRWRGSDKTECGIHFVDGRPVRGPAPHTV